MAGKIFINYRRGDDAGFTQALYLRLEVEFAAHDLFMDVEGQIKPGDDFVELLNGKVAAADVVLVVIGPRWSELLAARVGDPDDFVAIEIRAALEKGKRVIPVLVGGASMPRADTLPEAIRPLARRNAVGLRPERFKADCQGLVTALKEQLAAAEKERAARTDAERLAAEDERRNREAEEAGRIAAAEERALAQSAAGLSPEEIRRAEELANWDFIKERGQPQALRDHLARFPGGVTALYAMTRLEELVWAALGSSLELAKLQAFLDEFPKGMHVEAAGARVAHLLKQAAAAKETERLRAQETEAWGAVAAGRDIAAIEVFLRDWPTGQHAGAARRRIAELRRGLGGLRRTVLLGVGVMGAVAALFVGGWVAYFWDVTSALTREAEQALKPGNAFRECTTCPAMVVVPPGEFMMGSNNLQHEQPIRKVTFKGPFAVSKFEVTIAEWNACANRGGGCQYKDTARDGGKRPAASISWFDAKAYVAWLSKTTGKPYRLLTEAEWEYAARAGTTTTYSWGNQIGRGNANCIDCSSRWDRKETAPVGWFKPNDFGLHDMHGNVSEWVEDCYKDSYVGAPVDGSAWTTSCTEGHRVLRGGSWGDNPVDLRSANRLGSLPAGRLSIIGFRLARTLAP